MKSGVSRVGMDEQKTEGKKTSLAAFIRETRAEISKVTWPTRKETIQTTIMIVVMALLAGVFFFIIDWILGFAISHLLGMSA